MTILKDQKVADSMQDSETKLRHHPAVLCMNEKSAVVVAWFVHIYNQETSHTFNSHGLLLLLLQVSSSQAWLNHPPNIYITRPHHR